MLNKFSKTITQNKSMGAAQAMLSAIGIKGKKINNPFIGIASMGYEGNPCNMNLDNLAYIVKDNMKQYNMNSFKFNTIGVSDGISMGTRGMKYSLPSRELIADSIETVMLSKHYDGLITIPGCDKNIPGSAIAMLNINRPSIMLYGGSIAKGCSSKGDELDVVSAFQSYGEYKSGKITDEERLDIIENACPGAGSCGGMYTANTMATAMETMGLTLPYSSSNPALSYEKNLECKNISYYLIKLMENDIKPKDIVTKESFINAIKMITILGGSTNSVLHLIAIGNAANINITLQDFQKISDEIPYIADLKPSGKYLMNDLHKIGGIPSVMKYLLNEGILNGDCLTVTGKTIKENLKNVESIIDNKDNNIIKKLETPIKTNGHIQILYGNIAGRGSVAKITGKEGLNFIGEALVFDSEQEMIDNIDRIRKGNVIVIRYQGPKGGPGMPEMLLPTSTIVGLGLEKDVALITDGRFSGGSHGFIVGHISPEAYCGGNICLIEDGDVISISSGTNEINLLGITDNELLIREANLNRKNKNSELNSSYLKRYRKNVECASVGCIL